MLLRISSEQLPRIRISLRLLRSFSSSEWEGGTTKQARGFFDRARIDVRGGKGGHGCSSFARIFPKAGKGPPDGGNGGNGGDVWIRSSTLLHSLQLSKFHFFGQQGANGSSCKCDGAAGELTYVDVPVGTTVSEVLGRDESGKLQLEFIFDLDQPDLKYKLASGGQGGKGNRSFKNNRFRKNAQLSTSGEEGEAKSFLLELKVIADVGLVGYPNAGKSSLLTAISRAAPKVASYPFTTLHPHIGIVERNDKYLSTFSVADLPGLVDGAHKNVGLGHEFLRHIERTKVLVYVLDIAGTEGRDPVMDFLSLQNELKLYDPQLVKRASLIFANKCDRKPKTCLKNVERLREKTSLPIHLGSAAEKKGLETLLQAVGDSVLKFQKRERQLT